MGSSIPMIRGWGDDVADLGNGLDKLINPNHQVQNALKQAALTNPELIPQLGELERSNPGTLARLGLGQSGLMEMLGRNSNKLTEQITNTPESSTMQESSAQHAANVRRTDAETGNLSANTDLTKGITKPTIDLKTSEANVAKGTEGSAISSATSAAAIAKNKARESDVNIANMEVGLKKYPELANIDLADVASKIFHGQKLDAALSTRIQNDPALASSLDAYTKAMAERARNATEYDVQGLRNRSKSEQAMAFTQITQTLGQMQKEELDKQTMIHQSMPGTDVLALANSDEGGALVEGAKEKVKQWHDAKKELAVLSKRVEETRTLQKELSAILTDKVKAEGPAESTKQHDTSTIVKTKTSKTTVNLTPAASKLKDLAKSGGLTLDKVKTSADYLKLTPQEKKDFDSSYE